MIHLFIFITTIIITSHLIHGGTLNPIILQTSFCCNVNHQGKIVMNSQWAKSLNKQSVGVYFLQHGTVFFKRLSMLRA